MVSFFTLYSMVLVPPAVLLLILLTFPLPQSIDRRIKPLILSVADFIFLRPVSIFHGRTIFDIVFMLSVITLVSTTRTWQLSAFRHSVNKDSTNRAHTLMMKWRSERNFWIALYGTTTYWCLYRISAILHKYQDKKVNKKE